jgi:hypothetical protein
MDHGSGHGLSAPLIGAQLAAGLPAWHAPIRPANPRGGASRVIIADAIRQKQPFRGEMIEFLRDHFTEIRQADEIMILSFARTRADAK